MIRLHRVSKVYGVGAARIPALTDISFRLNKADFAVVTGPSGAGKTTLLRLLYREERPTEGEIEVAGFPVTDLRRREVPPLRRAIGIVFQEARLLPGRTIFENIAFVLRVLGTPRREITGRAFAALKAVGLSARAQAYPAQLSLGEAQRASLARAIAGSPALLLADEPTGNLDEALALEIIELLKDIWNRGTTVLLATHQAALCAQLERRTLTLIAGRLVKDEG
jgi:cell division transport system ATP-binding protein